MAGKNVLVEKALEFGIEIIKFCELLDRERKYVVSRQLLRSGTSIGANVFEAQHAESTADFIHKMKLAIKEASETKYWLRICELSGFYPTCEKLARMVEELIRILSKIIITSKKNI